jgi:hypothetical protein
MCYLHPGVLNVVHVDYENVHKLSTEYVMNYKSFRRAEILSSMVWHKFKKKVNQRRHKKMFFKDPNKSNHILQYMYKLWTVTKSVTPLY